MEEEEAIEENVTSFTDFDITGYPFPPPQCVKSLML